MKVLITGVGGFIGSHVAEEFLLHGHEVYGIDNFSTGHKGNMESFLGELQNFVEDDINNIDSYWDGIAFDAVIHLAALADIVPSIQNPRKYFDANVSGTLSVIEFVNKRDIPKVVYAASSSCYGIPSEYPTSEDAAIQARYPYALTKFMGEELLVHFSKLYGFEYVSLRLFNVYGPRARTTGTYGAVFGVFLKQLYDNKPLTVVGDGEQTRDFIYVLDVAKAFYLAGIRSKSCSVYNVGASRPVSINYLAKLLGAKEVINIPDRPGEPRQTFANISAIRKELDWEPTVSFEEGVDVMKEMINLWKDAPLWEPESIKKETTDWFKYVK